MRLILLDYGGTLSRLKDPVAFVKALKAKGDYPCLHTGLSRQHLRILGDDQPDLFHEVRGVFVKGEFSLPAILDRVSVGREITEVIVVDDEPLMQPTVELLDGENSIPWRFVYAGDIETLLS